MNAPAAANTTSTDQPATLLIGHGSPDPRHAAALRTLTASVSAVSGVRCDIAFLDHDGPTLAGWLRSSSTAHHGRDVRAVSLLLASGYHSRVDIPRVLAAARDTRIRNLGTVAPGPWLFPALERSVRAAGGSPTSPIVLVGAGSSDEHARADLAAFGASWAARRPGSVVTAAVTGPDPRPDVVLTRVAASVSERVVVPFMMAPGTLADRAARAAAAVGVRCTPPLVTEHAPPAELVRHLAALVRE